MSSTIRVVRKWQTDRSTISEFRIADTKPGNGEKAQGFFLERPGPDTAESGLRRRIPEGTYKLKWQNRTTLTGVRPHLPVPWLYSKDLPDSRYIYIHNGNYPSDTDGCLLIGSSRMEDMVGNSVTSLKKLKKYLNRVGIENVTVKITSDY